MKRSFLLVVALLTLLPMTGPTPACAPVLKTGATADVASETALIIWDKDKQTQHFIRRLSFVTDADDLAFLVPTPKKPEIAKADDEVFKLLEKVTAPQVVVKKRDRRNLGYGYHTHGYAYGSKGSPTPRYWEEVKVLGEGRVDALKYSILQAADTDALQEWLKENGYNYRFEVRQWLDHYVTSGWVITAFRFDKGPQSGGAPGKPAEAKGATELATTSVRMSFEAKQPFYPYREPADQWGSHHRYGGSSGRLLRVYFVGDHFVYGQFAAGFNSYSAEVPWANRLPDDSRKEMLSLLKLPETTGPKSAFLTEFEDRQSPRPANGDVFYHESPGGRTVSRPPVEQWEDPDPNTGPKPGRTFLLVSVLMGTVLALLVTASLLLWRQTPKPAADATPSR
jgi:hypothetical protein